MKMKVKICYEFTDEIKFLFKDLFYFQKYFAFYILNISPADKVTMLHILISFTSI